MKMGAAGKGHCIFQWQNLFLHCGGWFGCLWYWIWDFSGKYRMRSGASNSLETNNSTLLVLLWLLAVTEAATSVSSLLLPSSIHGIISETYHVKRCPSLSDKLCSHILIFHLISLWQEEAQAQSLNHLFHVI
jgi:hypothetical protein